MPQSLAKVYLHLIFSTKNREPVLLDDWRDELFRVMGGTANNLGCQSLIVGGTIDHVHMLFQLGRTITMADAIGKIKSTSSAWVNQNHALAMPFHWQAGYAVFSVSQSNVTAVREYIRRQPSITPRSRSKTNCAIGCGVTKSNGMSVTCGIDT